MICRQTYILYTQFNSKGFIGMRKQRLHCQSKIHNTETIQQNKNYEHLKVKIFIKSISIKSLEDTGVYTTIIL